MRLTLNFIGIQSFSNKLVTGGARQRGRSAGQHRFDQHLEHRTLIGHNNPIRNLGQINARLTNFSRIAFRFVILHLDSAHIHIRHLLGLSGLKIRFDLTQQSIPQRLIVTDLNQKRRTGTRCRPIRVDDGCKRNFTGINLLQILQGKTTAANLLRKLIFQLASQIFEKGLQCRVFEHSPKPSSTKSLRHGFETRHRNIEHCRIRNEMRTIGGFRLRSFRLPQTFARK